MKTTMATVGFLAASLLCVAQPSPTRLVDGNQFIICSEGETVCQIQVSGLAPHDPTPAKSRKSLESEGRRLQKYFYLLSGCTNPIQYVDEVQTNTRIAYTIHLSIYPPGVGAGSASVQLYRHIQPYKTPLLSVEDAEFALGPLTVRDGDTNNIAYTRRFLRQALDAFGQKYFGVPVSAIDDTNFNWSAHHTNTLAISYADFQPIQFPPANPKDGAQTK